MKKVFCITQNGRMKLKSNNILDAIKEVNNSKYYRDYGLRPLRLVLEESTNYEWREEWNESSQQ